MVVVRSSLLFLAMISSAVCQLELYSSYNTSSTELSGAGFCPSTEKLREKIREDVVAFFNNSLVPMISRPSSCGGPGWRRAAYLNMSDPTQTCPPAWQLITTPRRSWLDHLVLLLGGAVIQLCSLFKAFSTLRSVGELLDISLQGHKHLLLKTLINHQQLMVHMLME